MSEISTIYDAFVVVIEAALPAYQQHADAIDPSSNNSFSLEKGFSVGFGPASNTNKIINKKTVDQVFGVTLTNFYNANENDPDGRRTIEKDFIEDLHLLINAVENNTELGGCHKVVWLDYTNIDYFEIEAKKFMFITLAVSAEYFEAT